MRNRNTRIFPKYYRSDGLGDHGRNSIRISIAHRKVKEMSSIRGKRGVYTVGTVNAVNMTPAWTHPDRKASHLLTEVKLDCDLVYG